MGSTIKVVVSFLWGILVFNETVQSFWFTFLALILALVGLFGMSFFARPEKFDTNLIDQDDYETTMGLGAPLLDQAIPNNNSNSDGHDEQLQPEQLSEQKKED